MNIIKDEYNLGINVFFYEVLRSQLNTLSKELKIYFDEKNITLHVGMSTTDYTSIKLHFFKDKTIKEMEKENITFKFKDNDYLGFKFSHSYDLHDTDMIRYISFNSFPLWNGKSITQDVNLMILELKDIQHSQYYGKIKPNYDEHIDLKLSDVNFSQRIEYYIKNNLSYPFNKVFDNEKERKDFIYSKDSEWHTDFLFNEMINCQKYNLSYFLFESLYKKHKGFYIKKNKVIEIGDILNIEFILSDKDCNEYSIKYIYKKTEIIQNKKFSGQEITYSMPKYNYLTDIKLLLTPVDDKKYKKLITNFENIFN